MEEYFQEMHDLDMDRVRDDFIFIWGRNITQVELIREKNPEAGDYFHEDESEIEVRRKVWMNIQGISSNAYKRIDPGIVTTDAILHAYVKWDEDIENLDVIKFEKYIFRIINYNKSMYSGQYAFKEFDLKKIDQEETSVSGC